MMEHHRTLVANLLKYFLQKEPKSTLIETHISSVILSGEFAYKLKKPVDFGFLDFSTLEKRKEYCYEEVRINGGFAPVLAYGVVPIGGTPEQPLLDREPAIEYAVRMRRFAQEDQLDRVAASGGLDAALADKLALQVADLHKNAIEADAVSDFGMPKRVLRPVSENFTLLEGTPLPENIREKIGRIRAWSLEQHRELEDFFIRRKAEGRVRECHGDLHLHNIALVEGEVTPFDAIEFNPWFRWIDVISDLAFLLMDLEYTGEKALANRLLNRYLEETGDYGALRGLSFYKTYRAMVRVKVTALRTGQAGVSSEEKTALLNEIDAYLDLALGFTEKPRPFLALMHGLSGSGKSHAAFFGCGLSGGIRIRSDVERMRLFGEGVYTCEATRATYEMLVVLASGIVDAGYGVFVDATFLKAWQRELFEGITKKGVILECRCTEAVALARIAKRQAARSDVSEADREVYFLQKKGEEPLSEKERHAVVTINCNSEMAMQADMTLFVKSLR